MKELLDFHDKTVVNIFDKISLWAAPFGRLLLQHIPMGKHLTILDVGFGTGFPLVELAQRFGADCKIYGVDIWEEGAERAAAKIKTLALDNVEILYTDARNLPLATASIDLITSNLGINKFEQREQVYAELSRVLKKGGRCCFTTNPVGTFEELFECFAITLQEMNLASALKNLASYLKHRSTSKQIIAELKSHQFDLLSCKEDQYQMRFASAQSILDHSLIRIGFRAGWDNLVPAENRAAFYQQLMAKVEAHIIEHGVFKMSIPMLYLAFEKN